MTTRKTKATAAAEVVSAAETTIASRTPEVIAAEIRSIDQQARQYVLQSAIEIGRRLTEAKELVAHGEWGKWLKDNVNYGQSTANNFMRVAAEYSNSQSLTNLSYTQAVALLSVPAEERESFVEENNAAEMSTRELQAAIKERQEVEKQLAEERERLKAAELAHKEEQKQRELLRKQYQNLLEERQKLEADLTAAQAVSEKAPAKTDAKTKTELRKAEKALSESQQRLAALEAEMKAKEDELNAKVEAAIKEREKEMAEQARKREEESAKQVAELQEQLRKNNNTAAIKVKVHFESLVGNFNELIGALAALENEEQKKAISDRIAHLCDDMKAKL
jgi:chromosome segregation ATPase